MLKLNLAKRPCEPGHFHPIPTFVGLICFRYLKKLSLTIFEEIKKYIWRHLPHSYAYTTAQHLPIVQIVAAKYQDISCSSLVDSSKTHKLCTLYNTKSWLLLYCSCCIQGSTITMFLFLSQHFFLKVPQILYKSSSLKIFFISQDHISLGVIFIP